MREIGSEFSKIENNTEINNNVWLNQNVNEYSLVFSGRTAIDLVLKNAGNVDSALLPSYCCFSMIEPFVSNKISVDYYQVDFNNGISFNFDKVDFNKRYDVVLFCNYFGFAHDYPDKEILRLKQNGAIIVEDITHSFFSKKRFHKEADYLVASLRKWFTVVSGGYLASVKGNLKYKANEEVDELFISQKEKAMNLKEKYLQTNDIQLKGQYLSLFKKSNEYFIDNYHNKQVDNLSKKIIQSIDFSKIRSRRIQNASFLFDRLNSKIVTMFEKEEMDCPLFVPIVVKEEKQNSMIRKLITNDIYCPSHWPKPSADCNSNLYGKEISIVCDQRYSLEDMSRIIDILN